ncbi:putative LEA1 [Toxoplasma gondii TgCatPRC2]|uniref:LEA1 protein, putative n=4 Tax=Toxoplasma gondii TaxID=5811 RepID=B6KRG2_TOXGV|nr:hypothetical protein TGME49_276870 [Toxoplasma gondii ME49]ESS34668.1 putative LEA1 [Toxoplasma gondii VEG]KYF40592.1 putative LEA1 [Toxoplasma gondii ARI]KYK65176.1 putative LEA1 [Toxoplasma gondii TgCatPRC2]EPT25429.1 hypothetical protein TGME49_276870 [Toxoplasma gondii ME49]CEL78875.1 TPA: LEA1 protein, putative [Toxoplasma gondii VEG]|eukprot:XP_002370435.1 hypothetical protein TGME49_276870 [Toxoplasma gondii ME49]
MAKDAALDAKFAAKTRLTSVAQEATNIAKQMAEPVGAVKDKAKSVSDFVGDNAQALKQKGKQAFVVSGMKAKDAAPQTPLIDSASSAGRQLKDSMDSVADTVKHVTPKAALSPPGSGDLMSDEFKSIGEDAIMYGRELTGQTPKEAAEDVARVVRSEDAAKPVQMGKHRSN